MNYWQEQLQAEKTAHSDTLTKLRAADADATKARQRAREFEATSMLLGDVQQRLAKEQFEHDRTKADLVRARAELDTTQRALKQYKALHESDPFAPREQVVKIGPKA